MPKHPTLLSKKELRSVSVSRHKYEIKHRNWNSWLKFVGFRGIVVFWHLVLLSSLMTKADVLTYARSSSLWIALGESSRDRKIHLPVLCSGGVCQGWLALEEGGPGVRNLIRACLFCPASS